MSGYCFCAVLMLVYKQGFFYKEISICLIGGNRGGGFCPIRGKMRHFGAISGYIWPKMLHFPKKKLNLQLPTKLNAAVTNMIVSLFNSFFFKSYHGQIKFRKLSWTYDTIGDPTITCGQDAPEEHSISLWMHMPPCAKGRRDICFTTRIAPLLPQAIRSWHLCGEIQGADFPLNRFSGCSARPFTRLIEHLTVLRAPCNACLVSETPTCYVPAL